MSAITVTETVPTEQAVAWVRDLLSQADAYAVLRALRYAGPLCHRQRHSLAGPVGGLRWVPDAPPSEQFEWAIYPLAWHDAGPTPEVCVGRAASVDEAEAALVVALKALGWTCAEGVQP